MTTSSRRGATLPPGIQVRAGRYRSRVELPPDGEGRRRWDTATFATLAEAKRHQARVRAAVYDGSALTDPSLRLRVFLSEHWLPFYRPHHREASFLLRAGHVRNHLAPALGHLTMAQITAPVVQHFIDGLAASLQPATVRSIRSTLSAALTAAERWGVLPRNPVKHTDPPPLPRKRRVVWSDAEWAAFLAAEPDPDWKAVWATLAVTGMRCAELMALTWDDVDLDAGAITIRRTMTRTSTGFVPGPTKTDAGERRVAIPAQLVTQLRDVQTRQDARRRLARRAWPALGVVFDRGDGQHRTQSGLDWRWKQTTARAGICPLTPHALRHGNATAQLEAGIPLKVVSERLGHSSIGVTADLYSHVTQRLDREAAQALGDRLLRDQT